MAGSKKQNKNLKINKARIGIVASRFNEKIVESLLNACVKTLKKCGLAEKDFTIVHVPGAFELPIAAQRLLNTKKYDAVIALGAVIRGDTPHFEYICQQCASGLSNMALKHDRPVIFGVLTVDNMKQAKARSGPITTNKGADAAQAALETILALRAINK